jgi:DNA repair exonuclease SbcCD nuclease subunit
MRILRIGDMHVKPNNLEESEKLMHFINDKILEIQPDRVEILGDLYHTHAVIRLEVLEFWDGWLDVLTSHENIEIVVLIGNHDMTGEYSADYSALHVFRHLARNRKNLKIVQNPRTEGIYGYISYTHDRDTFYDICRGLASEGAKVLVCHQSFSTSKFESGTYDPEGFDTDPIPFDIIISGHIHAHQECTANGKQVIHPGTPKWDSASDANQNKGIWLYHHDDLTGKITKTEFWSTSRIVTPIFELEWKEGDDMPQVPSTGKITIELIGSVKWVSEQKKVLKGQYGIKTKITDKVSKSIRNPGKSFQDFMTNLYQTTFDRDKLIAYMKENSIV